MIIFTETNFGDRIAIHLLTVDYARDDQKLDPGFIYVCVSGKEIVVKGNVDEFFPIMDMPNGPN
jgi:hypothetical protein